MELGYNVARGRRLIETFGRGISGVRVLGMPMPMPMPMPPQGGELVEFEAEGEDSWVTLKLKDGSVLKFRSVVTAVFRVGNDPNTGLPVYGIQNSNSIRIVSIPKELIKKEKEKEKGSTTYR